MTELITSANSFINGYVWGWPMIVLLVGTGLLLTIVTGGVQFRYLGFALREVLGKINQKSTAAGEVSPFQAVATALASTVGVGNIAGVATAISIGGPGALFWLWVSGVLGMCTKFAEIVIALHYREPDATGQMRGGAMYVLRKGLGLPWLATVFAALVSLAAFGIGNMVQANSVAASLQASFGVAPATSGLLLAALTAAVILGGIKRIGQFTEYLVPFMALFYLAGGLFILVRFASELPEALTLVMTSAFEGSAAMGGCALHQAAPCSCRGSCKAMPRLPRRAQRASWSKPGIEVAALVLIAFLEKDRAPGREPGRAARGNPYFGRFSAQ